MKILLLTLAGTLGLIAADGKIVRLDPQMDAIAGSGAQIEKLAGGFIFTEGPIWIAGGNYLLFSDVPGNVIYKWVPGSKPTDFRRPIFPGKVPPGAYLGSNGLTLDKQGRLISCEHGNRRVARTEKDGKITVLADRFEGKKLNSPNDAVYKSNGDLYFTDPPYGFATEDKDPAKELPFNGVFRLTAAGKLEALVKDMTRPNGLAFSPDEKKLYVANSDPARKLWMVYDVKADGTLANGKVFFDANKEKADGLPDGMKVDTKGNIYATGPGGVMVFNPAGKHIGTIAPTEGPANCGWGDADGKTLYMTAKTGLYRVKLNIPGVHP